MLNLISMGVWALQGIMAIVVLGLSVDLVKGQKIGDAPTTTKYSTFTGGFGLAVAVLGLVSVFIDAIPALVVMAADALSGVLLLGGGIAFAIGLRGVACKNDDMGDIGNDIINGGGYKEDGKWYLPKDSTKEFLLERCKKATADQAMQFVTFGFALTTIVLVFLVWKNGRGGRGTNYV
ncbi:marvel domain-containing protein [Colletotrichum phormii]|uniref:Marvel domain-containing protein n=1 Tax=Colletotrichum phormii TaxID=359342 RepID=A0AAJ0EKS5_9PEZI|nr:marvel domain-containing protein [Colletotrichum phormii]KAK1640195.1 marvel domain-containing protein [Colletotrichum phormii]